MAAEIEAELSRIENGTLVLNGVLEAVNTAADPRMWVALRDRIPVPNQVCNKSIF